MEIDHAIMFIFGLVMGAACSFLMCKNDMRKLSLERNMLFHEREELLEIIKNNK